jgi:hypothetical protein
MLVIEIAINIMPQSIQYRIYGACILNIYENLSQAGGFDELIADCNVVDENIGSANVNIKKDEATAACDIKTKTNPAKGIIRY